MCIHNTKNRIMSKLAASWFVDGPRLVDLFADSKLGAPAQKAPWSSWNETMPASFVAVLFPKTDLYPWIVWYVPFDPGRTGKIDQRSARMAKLKWFAVRQQRQLSVISSRKGMASHQRQAQVLAWTCNRMCAQLVACGKPFFSLKIALQNEALAVWALDLSACLAANSFGFVAFMLSSTVALHKHERVTTIEIDGTALTRGEVLPTLLTGMQDRHRSSWLLCTCIYR